MSRVTRKKSLSLGASLVEYGLLVALIAVIAIPAVRNLGISNSCNYCRMRYCEKYGHIDQYYCDDPNGVAEAWTGDSSGWSCKSTYYEWWYDWCVTPDPYF